MSSAATGGGMLSMNATEHTATVMQKVVAAIAYGIASTLIMVLNKVVFSEFGFTSFLFVALLQYSISSLILLLQRRLGHATFPSPFSNIRATLSETFPLPLFFFANTISGLGATQRLNMPLFVLLRRFSIVMTLMLEMKVLGKHFSWKVKSSVGLMVLGAVIGASNDMTLQWFGGIMILLNDAFTALQGVLLRKKLDDKIPRLGSHGVMFYSNLYSIPLVLVTILVSGDEATRIREFARWGDSNFLACLVGSCVMGFFLNYTYFLCTKFNSPLTTTMIGAGKNIVTSYIGMLFKDYTNTMHMFVGVNVSMLGTLLYNYTEIGKMRDSEKQRARKEDPASSPATATVKELPLTMKVHHVSHVTGLANATSSKKEDGGCAVTVIPSTSDGCVEFDTQKESPAAVRAHGANIV